MPDVNAVELPTVNLGPEEARATRQDARGVDEKTCSVPQPNLVELAIDKDIAALEVPDRGNAISGKRVGRVCREQRAQMGGLRHLGCEGQPGYFNECKVETF